MGNLTDFYKQHRRLFLISKHQNLTDTEKGKDRMLQDFLIYCESRQIFHTQGINKKIVSDYFRSDAMLKRSSETKRKYYLVIREMFRRFLKKDITGVTYK
ncbi:MAG: hypothetical protein ACYCT7_03585 [bacterium]